MSIFQQTKDALDKAIQQKKQTDSVVKNIGGVVIDALRPSLDENARMIGEGFSQLAGAIKDIKVQAPDVPKASVEVKIPPINVPEPKVTVNIPEIKLPQINVPEVKLPPFPKVPTPQVTVNVPDFPKIPKLEWPETALDIQPVRLKDYDLQNPLPVQLRDANGKPVSLDVTNIIGGGGGGRGVVRIGGVESSAYASMMNADGRLKVSVETGGSGLTDSELRASHLDVQQLSGSVDSVYVLGAFGSSVVDGVFNADNRIRVSVETGGSGLTDTELRASHLDVQQLSGSIDSVYITGASGSIAANIVDSSGVAYSGSNPLPVTGSVTLSSESITLDHETDSIAVRQVSGFIDSVKVTGFDTSVGATILNGDGVSLDPRDRNWTISETVPVSGTFWQATQPVSATDLDIRDLDNLTDDVSVYQISGSMWSVSVASATVSIGATILNGEGLARDSWLVSDVTNSVKAALIDSTGVQYSGGNPLPITGTVLASDITSSIKATIIDSTGVGYSGSNPVPVNLVSQALASSASAIVDSTGVQYSGSNPLPIKWISGAGNSVVVVGPTAEDAVDDGNAPVQVGGVARTTNPTAVGDGDVVKTGFDDLGRQLTRPVQVRDLIATAYVAKTSGSTFGTETTLFAGASGVLNDLIMIRGTNDSTAAILVEIRGSTAGTVTDSFVIPAGGTAGVSYSVPYPAPAVASTWTIDLPDVTGTNVNISALLTKEV